MSSQAPRSKLVRLLVLSVVAVFLGIVTGLVTRLFIVLLEAIQHAIWTTVPSKLHIPATHYLYTIIACLIGGALVGVAAHFLGNYPKNIKDDLAEFQKNKKFDYKHIPQTFGNSLLSLGFGASLGPEAALTTIIGGLSTWMTDRLKLTLGHPKQSIKPSFANKLHFYVPVVLAFAVAYWVFSRTASGSSYFDLQTIAYTFDITDIFKSLLPIVVGLGLGIVFLKVSQLCKQVFARVKSDYLKGLIGGLVLGLLAAWWPLVLFSGHEGIQSIMTDYATISAAMLVISALAKSIAANTLLSTGWKGGQFFPVMFAGGAIGLSLTHMLPAIPAMVGLVAAMTAMLSIVVGKPVVAGVLVALFFPPSLYPAILVATVLPMLVMRLDRYKKLVT